MKSRYHHLGPMERDRIAALKKEGHSLRTIASVVGISHSTLSRELRRNSYGRGSKTPRAKAGVYDPSYAQHSPGAGTYPLGGTGRGGAGNTQPSECSSPTGCPCRARQQAAQAVPTQGLRPRGIRPGLCRGGLRPPQPKAQENLKYSVRVRQQLCYPCKVVGKCW